MEDDLDKSSMETESDNSFTVSKEFDGAREGEEGESWSEKSPFVVSYSSLVVVLLLMVSLSEGGTCLVFCSSPSFIVASSHHTNCLYHRFTRTCRVGAGEGETNKKRENESVYFIFD